MHWPAPLPPRLAVFDMDSTLIAAEVIDELARLHGVFDEVREVTRRAMEGELDFEGSLRTRVSKLEGLPVEALDGLADSLPLMEGAKALTAALRQAGCATALISGGFMFAATRIQGRLGLDHAFANTLEQKDGRLSGRVVGAVVTPERKAELFDSLLEKHGVERSRSFAVGDGANDIKMLARAGVGVAFHGKEALRKAATVVVDEGGLDRLLEPLGLG